MLCLSSLATGVSLASAAEGSVAQQLTLEEATPFHSLGYQLIYVDGEALGIDSFWAGMITGELHESTPLPALIEIGIPEGTLAGWFGQMPNRESFDSAIQFPEPYQVRTENGMDIYSAIMTDYRHMQLEFRYEGDPSSAGSDETMSINLSYAPIHDVPELLLTAAFPAGYVATEDDLIFRGAGPNSEQTYARVFENVSAGQTISTTIDGFYVGEGAVESTTDITTVIIIAAIAVAMGAAIYFFLARGKPSAPKQ